MFFRRAVVHMMGAYIKVDITKNRIIDVICWCQENNIKQHLPYNKYIQHGIEYCDFYVSEDDAAAYFKMRWG